MKVEINGEARDIPDGMTVASLLEHLGLTDRRVAVEVNRELVRRARHASTPVNASDKVEIVTLVGGG